MRVLGIDPGMAIVGYSLIDYDGKNCSLVSSGSIQTKKGDRESLRLLEILNDMQTIVKQLEPDVAAIEKLFFVHNQTTVMPVAHARGVILTVLEQFGIPIFEYTPNEIKQTMTGYGNADKKQMQEMVRVYLKMDEIIKPDDAADAVAIAIVHNMLHHCSISSN